MNKSNYCAEDKWSERMIACLEAFNGTLVFSVSLLLEQPAGSYVAVNTEFEAEFLALRTGTTMIFKLKAEPLACHSLNISCTCVCLNVWLVLCRLCPGRAVIARNLDVHFQLRRTVEHG